MLFRSDPPGSKPVTILGILVPRRLARWFARVWIAAVIVGSLLPGSAKITLRASEGKPTHAGKAVEIKHRFIHFLAFGSSFLVLSVLAKRRKEQLEAAVEVMIIGCIVETIQYFVYSYRHIFEWWDVRDDALGILAAFLLLQVAGRVKSSVGSRL
jgi:hypothetical protein